jgi:hypothetical protein
MKLVLAEIGAMNKSELDLIVEALKARRQVIAASIRNQISIGDNVKFTGSRDGRVYRGTVRKIGPKNVVVDCGPMQLYRVPASMLSLSA